MKNGIGVIIMLAAMLCMFSLTGCGDSEPEIEESSEILVIDADITAETTMVTTAKKTTDAKETTVTTTKTTAKKTETTAASTTAKTTAEEEVVEEVYEEAAADDDWEDNSEENMPEANEPAPAPTEAPTEAPTLPPEELTLKLGDDCAQYVSNVSYLSMAEGISCMGEGYDRTYDYGDYIVYTFADYAGTGDYVQEIDLITDMYSTNAGIHVGNTRGDVEAAYGTTDTGRYYSSEGGFLMFMYDENDVVTLIMYCKD